MFTYIVKFTMLAACCPAKSVTEHCQTAAVQELKLLLQRRDQAEDLLLGSSQRRHEFMS